MNNPEAAFLSGLHAHPEGLDSEFCKQLYRTQRYKRMLREKWIREVNRLTFITTKGITQHDTHAELLPTAFKNILFANIPAKANKEKYRNHVVNHLEEEGNIRNLREYLPQLNLRAIPTIMETSPEEIALVLEGSGTNGEYHYQTPLVLLVPHFEPEAEISNWVADTICKYRKELATTLKNGTS